MKYLFIGGPLDKEYEEASGNHHEVCYEPPPFTLYEEGMLKPCGLNHTYVLRSITLGIDDIPVYVSDRMSDAEVLRQILTAYYESP